MKLWILGKNGFLGKELIKACDEAGIFYLATSHKEVDITKPAQFPHEGTHIVNCSAYTLVDEAEKNQELAYAINAQGPENLGEFSKKFGKKIIHISTDYVFDGTAHTPYKETDACNPINVYGQSKWLGEKQLLEKNPNACIIRSSWLFGKGGKNFVSSIFQLLKEKESLRVITDQKGRPTFCPDLARVILSMLDQSGIFHFANQGARSRFEIAQDVLKTARELGIKMACNTLIPVSSSEFRTPAKRPAYSVLNTDKIEEVIGKPRTWEEVLKEYISNAI